MKKILILLLTAASFSGPAFSQFVPYSAQLSRTGLYKANDATPKGNSINSILTIGDTVWVGTGRGLSRSTDKGRTWTNYYQTPEFGEESISAIAYGNGIIWAATAHSVDREGQSLPEGSGIRFSTNNGQTWNVIPQSVDQPGDTVVVYGNNRLKALPVTVAIQNIIYDMAVTSDYIWITTWAGGTRKAPIDSIIANPNLKWQRVVLPPDYLNSIRPTDKLTFHLSPSSGKLGLEQNLNHMGFSLAFVDDDTLYVGTAGGINKSTDGGISWVKFTHINQYEPISGNFVVALGYNSISGTLFASTWPAEGKNEFTAVSYSTDNGTSWHTTLNDEKAHDFGFRAGETMAATDNGVFRTSNNGISWLLPSNITDKSTNAPLLTNVFNSASSQQDSIIWLGSEQGLVRLSEKGGMWQGNWQIFLASTSTASTNETYAFPNPFSPDAEYLKIKFNTGGKAAKVTIRIFDFGMNLVRTVIQNVERNDIITGGENTGVVEYWDGRNESGEIVPNGVYFYRIDLGSGDPLFGKILVVM